MVGGQIPALLLGILKFREVGNDQETVIPRLSQSQHIRQLQPQPAQRTAHSGKLVRAEQDKISRLSVYRIQQALKFLLRKIFRQDRIRLPVILQGDPCHSLGPQLQGLFRQLLNGAPGKIPVAFHVDGPHHTSLVDGFSEHGKAASLELLRQIHDRKAEPQIRLIASIPVHRLLPGQTGKRLLELDAQRLPKQMLKHFFQVLQDVLLVNKGKLHVHLGKFRLAVRAQILIRKHRAIW